MNRSALACSLVLLGVLLLVPVALATIGTGVLYIYTDTWGGTEAPQETTGNQPYVVEIGGTYYIRVTGITEFLSGVVDVKLAWTGTDGPHTNEYDDVPLYPVGDGTTYFDIMWIVPENAQYCTTGTVHYLNSDGTGPDYIAQGQFNGQVTGPSGHFHVVPEISLGAVGASAVFLLAFGLFAIRKKRRLQ